MNDRAGGFSVYVHVPFCLSRCPYCAFYSGEPLVLLPGYPGLLARELHGMSRVPRPEGRVNTVYFGGGTPSLLGPEALGALLEAVDHRWGLAPGAEVTLEANPADLLDYPGLRAAGVNRLSLGVQALDDGVLTWLGRRHSAAQALAAVGTAAREGFRVSADLLFGLPDGAPGPLREAPAVLRDQGVEHLSTYSLEFHPGTPFGLRREAGTLAPAGDDEEDAQWRALHEGLEAQGFRPYEVSNYALPGGQCRHNLAYWEGDATVGLGPGAHGFAPGQGDWGTRFWNHPDLPAWADALDEGRLPPGDAEPLEGPQALLEHLFLSLRRPAPVAFHLLAARHGRDLGPLLPRLAQAVSEGLLTPGDAPGCFSPSLAGMRRADGLALWLSEGFEPDPPPDVGGATGR